MKIRIIKDIKVCVEHNGEESEYDILDNDRYANEIVAVARNPKYSTNGDIGGEVNIIRTGEVMEVIPHDEERIKLIERMLRGENVDNLELIPYGEWKLFDKVLPIWKDDEFMPVSFGFVDRVLLTEKVERRIFDMVHDRNWREIPVMRVSTFGSLVYPLYYNKVRDVDDWIFLSLKDIVAKIYTEALEGFLKTEGLTVAPPFFVDLDWAKIVIIKIEMLKMYVNNRKKFINIVCNTLENLLRSVDNIPESMIERVGDFKSPLWKYLRNLRKEVLEGLRGEIYSL